MPNTSRPLIVVFDGQCLFCNAWVRFLLRHDRRGVFCFAAIQGRTGQALLQQAGLQLEGLETLLLVDGREHWQNTDAVLRILRLLGWPWRVAGLARWVPAALRDALYRWLARNRYRLFGRAEHCMVPPPELRARFLD
jgi:predicted DCC family thiol-disulfide oxidoreductase YuxK